MLVLDVLVDNKEQEEFRFLMFSDRHVYMFLCCDLRF